MTPLPSRARGRGSDRERAETGRNVPAGPSDLVEERAPDQPADLPARSWKAVLRGTVKEFRNDELADRAAALTYYGVLALFPALLVLVSLLGVAGESTTARLSDHLQQLTPGSAGDVIRDAVEQLQGHSGVGSLMAVVGLAVALWSASGYVAAFIRSANAVYDVPEGRPVWKVLPLRLALTVTLMVLACRRRADRGLHRRPGPAGGRGPGHR